MQTNAVYLNPKQMQFLSAEAPEVSVFFGGRGAGKTGALAFRVYMRAAKMPRGHFFLGASTIDQVNTKIYPEIKKLWRDMLGLVEGTHYVKDIKPPRWFAEPISTPDDYKNVISWWNGSWTEVISYRKHESYRGASFDGGDIDEALLWSWYAISSVIIPTLRGNLHTFKQQPLHHNLSLYTSPPRDAIGMWIYNLETKAKADPRFFWIEATADDNVAVLGTAYKERMRAALSAEDYAIEIECQRNFISGDSYYHAFDFHHHGYLTLEDGQVIDAGVPDYSPEEPIDLTFDFGGNFNCMMAAQTQGLTVRFFDALHVKFRDKLPTLVRNFATKYQAHQYKHVNLYGEPFGMKQREDNIPLFEQVAQLLQGLGWTSTIYVDQYDRAARHKERYISINNLLREDDPFLPRIRIHRERCADAIIAIQRTKITEDFNKDKKEEKAPKRYPPEHAPHYTDAFDNYLRQRFDYMNRTQQRGLKAGRLGR